MEQAGGEKQIRPLPYLSRFHFAKFPGIVFQLRIVEVQISKCNGCDSNESEAYYILDRGYVDYTRLSKITYHSAYFVKRTKSNLKFDRMYSKKVDKTTAVECD